MTAGNLQPRGGAGRPAGRALPAWVREGDRVGTLPEHQEHLEGLHGRPSMGAVRTPELRCSRSSGPNTKNARQGGIVDANVSPSWPGWRGAQDVEQFVIRVGIGERGQQRTSERSCSPPVGRALRTPTSTNFAAPWYRAGPPAPPRVSSTAPLHVLQSMAAGADTPRHDRAGQIMTMCDVPRQRLGAPLRRVDGRVDS